MKTHLLLFTALLPFAIGLSAFYSPPKVPVKHIVVFRYKSTATPQQITEVTEAFKALKNKIPGIVSFEYGVNNSPEKLNKGFTHVYLLTFEDAAARDAYLPHPEHKKFGELLGKLGVLEEPFVVDFEVGK
ncbi:MAG TPA: Dabb family protein [Cyclobacteriaceae bacterium]|nr:Dabb family protein [Cyclobacteriaceae bacterium]